MQLKNRQKQLKIESKKKILNIDQNPIRDLLSKDLFFLNEEAGYELNKIKDQEQEIKII